MYQDHVSLLNAAMRCDPDIFVRGVTFAVLSIRQQFPTAVKSMGEVEMAGTNARALWGYKRGAYDFIRKNKFAIHSSIVAARTSEEALSVLTTIPGLGIVKAAFVAQMMGHDIGCLDSRNIFRLRLNPREWRSDGEDRKNTLAFKRKIKRYVDFTSGRAEELWDDWCNDIAPVYASTAEEISRDHLVIVPPQLRQKYRNGSAVPIITREDIPYDGLGRNQEGERKPENVC